ncbi:MAG: SDR family NAD(P)-dependent oxidoreductase [Verrucomicrobiota bacterium]
MPTPSEYLTRFSVIIITGGSSGIGSAFIKAIRKINPEARLCNLSRSEPEDFLGEPGIHLATDLTDAGALADAAAKLDEILAESPPGEVLLINNSGFGDYGPITQMDVSKQLKMIDLNVRAMVDLTGRLLPRMLERGGCVVNVASTAAYQPTPYLATYGATKAFVLHWTLALNEDLRRTGLRALAVCPGPTRSNFFKAAGFSTPPMQSGKGINGWLDMGPDEVAELSLRALARGKTVVVTGWKNRLVTILGGKTPKAWVARLGGALLRKMRLERHRGEDA